MRIIVSSIEAEFRRYRALGEAAIAQLDTSHLGRNDTTGNSVATIAWHIGGNLASRFTDFLSTDGEKPWRQREDEFAERAPSHEELSQQWNKGWAALEGSLGQLSDSDLGESVQIRGTDLLVAEALHRALAHISYHVGQIVHLARQHRGDDWQFLSIPPGGSAAYNANPTKERARSHAADLQRPPKR